MPPAALRGPTFYKKLDKNFYFARLFLREFVCSASQISIFHPCFGKIRIPVPATLPIERFTQNILHSPYAASGKGPATREGIKRPLHPLYARLYLCFYVKLTLKLIFYEFRK